MTIERATRIRVIGPFRFPTRKAAEVEIRRILHDSPLDEPLVGDDRVLIESLLACHHEAAAKIGPGIADITVRRIEYGSRGFWVIRVDGTATDFSYKTALDGARSDRQTLLRALRAGVRDQIDTFRQNWFDRHADADGKVVCPLTGQRFTLGPHAHVDHVIPFAELAGDFIEDMGGVNALPVQQSRIHAGPELADPAQAQLWAGYHHRRAELRVVHQSANLARHRGAA